MDRMVHLVGLPAGIAASAWLLVTAGLAATAQVGATLLIYSAGLVGMLGASAAYHLSRPGRAKERLRRLDHAMIFVMIAGTYTPFTLNVLPRGDGRLLCAAVWGLAATGVTLKLAYPRRLERLSVVLYLGMGWMVLFVVRTLAARMPSEALLLLGLGGVAYTVGTLFFSLRRVPFQNVVWHLLVLLGAGLHLAAIRLEFAPPA